MKINAIILILPITILLTSCSGMTNNETSIVTYNNAAYEEYQGSLTLKENLSKTNYKGQIAYFTSKNSANSESKGSINVQTYEGDSDNIFIFVGKSKWTEGTIFHKKNDIIPNLTDKDRISNIEIALSNNSEAHSLSPQEEAEYIEFLSKIMSNSKDISITETDGKPGEGSVETYFKNYPAYDNSILIKQLKNGETGIEFSETALNKEHFGDYDNAAVIPTALKNRISG